MNASGGSEYFLHTSAYIGCNRSNDVNSTKGNQIICRFLSPSLTCEAKLICRNKSMYLHMHKISAKVNVFNQIATSHETSAVLEYFQHVYCSVYSIKTIISKINSKKNLQILSECSTKIFQSAFSRTIRTTTSHPKVFYVY